jgi:hypothetical protein
VVWESIDSVESQAILAHPPEAQYVGGFPVGSPPDAPRPALMLQDNGMADVPVPQNNTPTADPELERQRSLDALGGVIIAAGKATKTPGKAVPGHVRALVWLRYGVDDVRKLSDTQITELSKALTDDPALLVPEPMVAEAAALTDDDPETIPPFDAPPAEIDADEAARILAREQAEAEGRAE